MKGRKILFLCAEAFPPPYDFLDQVFNVHLLRYGYETVWIMPCLSTDTIGWTRWRGRPVVLLPKLNLNSTAEMLKGYQRHFRGIGEAVRMAREKYGPFALLQVRDDPAMAFLAYSSARRWKIPWVYQVSHFKEEEAMMYARMGIYGSRFKNLLKGVVGLVLRQFLVNRCPLIFPISEQMKQTLKAYGWGPGVMIPIEEGVDTRAEPCQIDWLARKLRKQWGLGQGKVIVYVGTMSRFRRLDFLLESFRRVLSTHPHTRLLMVGEGRVPEDLGWLKEEGRRLGIADRVMFTGWLPKNEVRACIRASDIGVSPIPRNRVYINSSPIKVLEYLAMEVPAVGTNIPDQKRVLEQSGGGLCVEWNLDAFTSAICKMLSLGEAERAAMGRRGRRWVVENRDYSVLSKRIDDAYRALERKYFAA